MPTNFEIPWDWYIIRASGLIGFLLLYISVFAGTISCLPGVRNFFLKLRTLNLHCWISVQALAFTFVHAILLLFHKFIPFSLKEIFVPFASDFEPELVAMGIVSFYLMIILIATSYARRWISQKIWRAIHFLNIALYILAVFHSLYLGTDLKNGLLRQTFIWANVALLLLLFFNMVHRVWAKLKKREIVCEIPAPKILDENIRQGHPSRPEERNFRNFRRRI